MATTRVKREPFGTIEVPADRLWGGQTQREVLMEMEFYQWTQSKEMIRPVVKRFTPD